MHADVRIMLTLIKYYNKYNNHIIFYVVAIPSVKCTFSSILAFQKIRYMIYTEDWMVMVTI